jgi:uncharacterized protein YjhX (UPF0386 family)
MNVSRDEQRVLHALAQGGAIYAIKDERGKLETVECHNRDGFILPTCTVELVRKLRSKRAILSQDGGPYRISRRGLDLVRPEYDNR